MRKTGLHRSQKGFALVSALFVLIVLALLGAVMALMSGAHSSTPLYALQGAKAYQAARSGVEWGIHQALNASACAPATTFALDGFSIRVSCQSITYQEGGPTPYTIYQITAEAEDGTFGQPGYVSRQVEARISNAP